MIDLSTCKVGDRVRTNREGWGVITEISNNSIWPITANFSGQTRTFTKDGMWGRCDREETDVIEVLHVLITTSTVASARHTKPPLGIMPHKLWVEFRCTELIDTLNRHRTTPQTINTEWLDELKKLIGEL